MLIPLAIVVLIIAIAAFIWAVKSGQFEDMEGPAHRILMDDDDPLIPSNARIKSLKQEKNSSVTEKTDD